MLKRWVEKLGGKVGWKIVWKNCVENCVGKLVEKLFENLAGILDKQLCNFFWEKLVWKVYSVQFTVQ